MWLRPQLCMTQWRSMSPALEAPRTSLPCIPLAHDSRTKGTRDITSSRPNEGETGRWSRVLGTGSHLPWVLERCGPAPKAGSLSCGVHICSWFQAPASPSVPGEGWRQLTHTEMKREEGLGQQDPREHLVPSRGTPPSNPLPPGPPRYIHTCAPRAIMFPVLGPKSSGKSGLSDHLKY